MSLQEDWDVFFQQRPDGGPWDVENNYNPDISILSNLQLQFLSVEKIRQ